ncbi:glycosyltransferase family 4 protein [Saccharothrix saharensis]|uniref:glycosyltransferase family 4 protein n=1 Tax=Saccharothrix saharensis TaxID=571190 RepID=UPI0036A97AF7
MSGEDGRTAAWTVAFVDLDGSGHRDVAVLARGLGRIGPHVVHYVSSPSMVQDTRRYEQALLPEGEDAAAWLAAHWASRRPELVHGFGTRSAAAARVALAGSLVPLVADWCSFVPSANSVPAVDHYTVTGAAEAAALVGHGVARAHIGIVVNGIDAEFRQPDPGRGTSAASRARLVCHTRLLPDDGTDTVIAALRWLPDTDLVVIAAGITTDDARTGITRLLDGARRLGVADRVRVVDHHSHAAERLIGLADLVVHVPRAPGPLAPVLEAMARGKPVIASATGDLGDTVIAGVTGLLVTAGDPSGLGRAARRLLTDRTKLAAFSVAAIDRIEQRHTPARVATDLQQVYRDILERSARGGGRDQEVPPVAASKQSRNAQSSKAPGDCTTENGTSAELVKRS